MVSPEEAEAYLNATLIGMVRVQTAFLPIMRAQNAGRIVTIVPRMYVDNSSLCGWKNAVRVADGKLP